MEEISTEERDHQEAQSPQQRDQIQADETAWILSSKEQRKGRNEAQRLADLCNAAEEDIEVLNFPIAGMNREVSFKKADKYAHIGVFQA